MQGSNDTPSDALVVKRVLAGETDCFLVLVARHKHAVLKSIRGCVPDHAVEPLAREAFVSAFRQLEAHEAQHCFISWLLTLAVRQCIEFWRRVAGCGQSGLACYGAEKTLWLQRLDDSSKTEPAGPSPTRLAELTRALHALPPEDRVLLSLLSNDGLTIQEAARVLDWSARKVRARRRQALAALREAASLGNNP